MQGFQNRSYFLTYVIFQFSKFSPKLSTYRWDTLYFKGGLKSEGILELVKIGNLCPFCTNRHLCRVSVHTNSTSLTNFLSSIKILSKYLIEIHRICLEVILNAIMVQCQYFLPTLNLRKKKYESW